MSLNILFYYALCSVHGTASGIERVPPPQVSGYVRCPWLQDITGERVACDYIPLECFRKHDFAPLLLSPAFKITIPARCSIRVVRKPWEEVFSKTLYYALLRKLSLTIMLRSPSINLSPL